MKKVIRIFPSRTKATPDDTDVRIKALHPTNKDEADQVHISVAFTWDIPTAEKIAKNWRHVAPVTIGGPAYNNPGGDFVPGMYLKKGYVITSRGCPNRCWFCNVPKREGFRLRELPITEGHILTDDNLLACSTDHIEAVFNMLSRQKERPQFTGGLEAKLLTPYYAKRLYELRPKSVYFAYDTPDDLDPLIQAGRYLLDTGFTKPSHVLRAYVLIGYRGDTFDKAIERLTATWDAGFFPMAMLYRDQKGGYDKDWRRLQREWANPIITAVKCNELDKRLL
ncbi:MAG: hypothetical protein LIO79_07680 [Rikenellaceae bacterium]|nr:hypothetical protein [Rikenellaceae bacterium]